MPRIVVVAALVASLTACGAGQAGGADTATTPAEPPQTESATTNRPARTAQSKGVRLATVGRFESPLFVTGAPGDTHRVYVVEQTGRIRVVQDGRKLAQPFLDISDIVNAGGEQGLLGLAFAPDFAKSKRFYVYYTDLSENQNVVEYRAANRNRANTATRRVVMHMVDPESNHNGGNLAFGPDRLLYIGTGDGGSGNDPHGSRGNGQNLSSLLGKILRIDPRRKGGRAYRIPASNPFRGRSGARPEIYSYGLRNPWRYSFDRKTGALIIGDVGQDDVEEIDFMTRGKAAGANFGWRAYEGKEKNSNFDESAPGHVPPVIEHSHDDGWCSITGGYVVRDPSLPSLEGTYVYGDYCKGDVWGATLRTGGASNDRRLNLAGVGAISSFGQDTRGRIYVTSLNGPVYRLAPR